MSPISTVEVAACGRTLEALRSAAALKTGPTDSTVPSPSRVTRGGVAAAIDVVAHPQHGAVDVQRADVARNGRGPRHRATVEGVGHGMVGVVVGGGPPSSGSPPSAGRCSHAQTAPISAKSLR